MTDLTRIANKCNTDKGTVAFEAHGYTEEYSKYIPNLGNYTLLEIGVWHCDSLRMWQEYNPDMNIVGLEVDPGVVRYIKKDDIYEVYVGNATNPEFIEKVLLDIKSPDFIIDDGSHRYEDILGAFKLLYPALKPGGYYFIEDLHPAYAEKHRLIEEITLNFDFKNHGFRCDGKLWIIEKP